MFKFNYRISIICCMFLLFNKVDGYAQQNYKIGLIGFYNLENLFDTINQPDVNDEDFTPDGANLYTPKVYMDKLAHLSDVISQIGADFTPDGLSMFGVAEVENITVIRDLIHEPKLKARNYAIVHYDSKDLRGIDVGLVYSPKYLKVKQSESLHVDLKGDDGEPYNTRDVLYVYGLYDGEPIHIFVNHWPSRRGGEEASAPNRAAAARVCKLKIDSINQATPNAKIIVMGDLNDDPVSPSVAKVLGATGDLAKVKPGGLYNPWVKYYKDGIGTLAYNDAWNLFDQIMVSEAFLPKTQEGFFFQKAVIFKKEFMMQNSGRYKGYPKRTYDFSVYMGGYSDHFPTFIEFLKPVK
ncbi:endonuclease [soil metagenome]